MNYGSESSAGSQPSTASEASSGKSNSNSRLPSAAASPRPELGLRVGLVAVKQEMVAAASAPSGKTDLDPAPEPVADDKSLIRRLQPNTWSQPPTNQTASQGIASMPISHPRIPHEGLPLGQISAAQSHDTPAGRQTVHDGALPGRVGAMRDNRAPAGSAARIGMVAATSEGDSNGANNGTTETTTDRDAQHTSSFAQGARRVVGHSVSNHHAGSSDRGSGLNYPGTASVQEHITVCSGGGGIPSLDPPTISPRAEPHAIVEGQARPKTATEQHERVGATSDNLPDLSDTARRAGASVETSPGAGLDAGGSDRLAAGRTTIAVAPRSGTTGLRDAQRNHVEGSGHAEGDDAHKTGTDIAPSRADTASRLPPASSVPRRSKQPTASGHALTGGQSAIPIFANARKSGTSEGGVSAARGLSGGSGSGVNSQQTAQSGSATPSAAAGRSYFLPMDFFAGTALPDDDICVRGSRGSLGTGTPRHPTTDNAGGGGSHNAVGRSAATSSVQVETAPTESLPSAFEREQAHVRQEQLRLASLEEHTMDDSAGDTVNVALAALSYADAAASAPPGAAFGSPTPVGAENGFAGQDRQSFSCSAGGELAISGEDRGMAAMENLAPPENEQAGGGGSAMSSLSTVSPTAARLATGASARSEENSQDALASLGSAAPIVVSLPSSTTQAAFGGFGSSTVGRREKGARARDRRDDMMHAMCMICLEKLSEPADGGGAKLLGLLDSCAHRYCYMCILEWSKITNKCPQCASRFHTIKAVKELRRNNNRYRGVAVDVEDRDQVYSFVDLRDVVVLDPDVACYPDCLLRGAADAFQQPGWEFSVQCEQCSDWFHGVCAGYGEEQAVPDRWFCNSCRGESHQTVQSPGTVIAPAARATASSRGRGSSGRSRARGRGRGRGRGQASGRQNRVPSPVSAQIQEQGGARSRDQAPEQDASDVSCGALSRTAVDESRATSTPATENAAVSLSAAPQQAPASPTPPVPPVPAQSTPSPSPTVAAAPRGRGRPRGSVVEAAVPLSAAPQPVLANPTPPAPLVPVQSTPSPSPAVTAAPSERGRPRGSTVEPAVPSPLSAALQPAPASPTPPAPPVQAQSAQSPSRAVAAEPPRARGRPRGSKNAVVPSAKPPVVPVTAQVQAQPELASPPSVAPPASPPPVPPPPVPPPPVLPSHGHQEQQQEAQPPPIADQSRTGDGVSEGGCVQRSPAPPQCAHGDDVIKNSPDVPSGPPERPPGLPARPAPSLLRTLEASEMSELCDVCGFDTERDNLIVYCESCNMGVHQTCYGISQIPTKEWYCSPCSSGVHPSTLACRFCPVQGGALKRCTDGKWGHILCAFWIPECCFIDPRKMEPIGSINKRGQAGGVERFLPTFRFRKCYICGTSIGSAIRCHSSSCKFHLHPMCGSRAGSVYMEIETTMKTAADGTELEAVNLVAKCPRHNKNKAIVNRSRKSREAMALAADPLRIAGKTIEIADPEKDGAVVLTGKVTWFDQDRSRYCIMRSFSDVGGEGNVGGSSSGGGGSGLEATGGCAHWITMEKLVGAKAERVDLRSGKRFAVEPPHLAERSGEDTGSESESQGNRVKSEEKEHEEEREGANKEESGRPPTEEDKDKRENTAGDEEEKRGDITSSVLEEDGSDEAEVRAVARGKRRGRHQVSPTSSPGAASAKRTARAGMQTRRANSNSSVELDLQRAQEETEGAAETPPCPTSLDQGGASVVRDGDEAASDDGDTASPPETDNSMAIAKHAKQQRPRLLPLPSVQVPEPSIRSDPFSRYPIRGRLKRPFQPPEPQESDADAVRGVSSAKRRRAGEETTEELAIPATAGSNSASNEAEELVIPAAPGSDSTSNEGVEGPNEAPTADDYVPPAPTPPKMNERIPVSPRQGSHTATDVPTASGSASRTEAVRSLPGQASCTAYVVEPGWPKSRDAPGQMPVMRVRTVRITGGKEAMYFASAYTGVAASLACGKRSTSRFTFPFETFEETEAARADELPNQEEAADERLKVLPQQSCDPVETQEMDRAGDVVQDDVAKVEAATEEVNRDEEARSPQSEGAKHNRGEGCEGGAEGEGGGESKGGEGSEGDGEEAAQANELPKDTMSSSTPQGGDTSEMEDGEIETLLDGRADTMPPSPPDEDMESVLDVIGHGAEDVLEVEVAEATDDPPGSAREEAVGDDPPGSAREETVGDDSDGAEGVQLPMHEAWAKNMAISSDEISCGEPEGDDSSFCSFEDVLKRAEDESSSDEDSPDTKLGGHACDSTTVAESNVAAFSPETAQIPQAPQELPQGAESPEAEIATAEEAPPTPPPSPPDLQEQAATNALRTIVREQLQDILRSASTGGEAALASGNGAEVFRRIAVETEEELFERLYNRSTGGREYKAKYKQLLLSVGNVRNYRLVASVLEGNTTPVDLATKDAVGLLKSLSSSLNCLAIPLAGRNRQGAGGRSQRGRGRGGRRGKMRLLG